VCSTFDFVIRTLHHEPKAVLAIFTGWSLDQHARERADAETRGAESQVS